jgi:hypothetical protein
MNTTEVLFAGGSGVVGREAIKWFRMRHPNFPLLVGGRSLQTAEEAIQDLSAARAVVLDLDQSRMGLKDDIPLAAIVMLAPDSGLKGLSYAQDLRIPYVNIGNGLTEVGPEMAHFAHRALASPILLASHWSAGAALFLTLESARNFEHVHSIRIGVLLDEKDRAGPLSYEDMERTHDAAPATLVFQHGKRTWLSKDDSKGMVKAIDGRRLEASPYSPFDIISLHAATGADNIRFDLVTGESSSRRRGGEAAAEIVVEIEGETNGQTTRLRSALEFKYGQASLTGLSVALSLSPLLGLDGRSPARPGLYLPELLSDATWFLGELRNAGAVIYEDHY